MKHVCFSCNKELTKLVAIAQPYHAIEFTTSGHYGTAYFDPIRDNIALIMFVCDECLKEKADRMYVKVEDGHELTYTVASASEHCSNA